MVAMCEIVNVPLFNSKSYHCRWCRSWSRPSFQRSTCSRCTAAARGSRRRRGCHRPALRYNSPGPCSYLAPRSPKYVGSLTRGRLETFQIINLKKVSIDIKYVTHLRFAINLHICNLMIRVKNTINVGFNTTLVSKVNNRQCYRLQVIEERHFYTRYLLIAEFITLDCMI